MLKWFIWMHVIALWPIWLFSMIVVLDVVLKICIKLTEEY